MRKERLDERIPEVLEIDKLRNSAWFGGFLIRGTITPNIDRRGYSINTPYIRIIDRRHPEKIALLTSFYGNQSNQFGVWMASGEQAITHMKLCRPFLPSRRHVIDKCLEIISQPTEELRKKSVESARLLSAEEIPTSVDEYRPLISKYKKFTAGIIDSKAMLDLQKGRIMRLQFKSPNKSLLIALQEKYLGSINIFVKSGTQINISGMPSKKKVSQDVWVWTLGHLDTLFLIDDLREHLFFANRAVDKLLNQIYNIPI